MLPNGPAQMPLIGKPQIGRKTGKILFPLGKPIQRPSHPNPIPIPSHGNPHLSGKRPAQPISRHPQQLREPKQPLSGIGSNSLPRQGNQLPLRRGPRHSRRSRDQPHQPLRHPKINVPIPRGSKHPPMREVHPSINVHSGLARFPDPIPPGIPQRHERAHITTGRMREMLLLPGRRQVGQRRIDIVLDPQRPPPKPPAPHQHKLAPRLNLSGRPACVVVIAGHRVNSELPTIRQPNHRLHTCTLKPPTDRKKIQYRRPTHRHGPPMRSYRRTLGAADFRRLWLGATISTLGDGMTFVALSWLVLSGPHGATRLSLLAVCYTAPVVIGGLAAGPILDRFDKRTVLFADCVFRAALMSTIPITAALHTTPPALPFIAAAGYGLLKMLPLAGFPAAIPALVPESDLDTANALESLTFSIAGVLGPALSGLLIPTIGAANVLAIDSATFIIFAATIARVRHPLRATPTPHQPTPPLRALLNDKVIVRTTIAFMAFNIAEGMLLVAAPWLAKTHLPGGATTLGVLLALTATGEITGATLAGLRNTATICAIGVVQLLAAACYLALLAPRIPILGAGFLLVGLLSAPMTVWAQTLRMRRIPPALHGRAFAVLRTLMQGTLPLGSLLVTPFVATGSVGRAAITMTLIAGLPALMLLVRTPAPVPAAAPSHRSPEKPN